MKVLNNDRDETVRFRIEPRIGDDGIYLELKENGNRATTVFPPSDAPALCLTILEAAGHVRDACSDNDADVAMEWLHSAIARQAKQSAEAKEQAELEAEALELLNAYRAVSGGGPLGTWRQAGGAQEYWLAVARKAREMRAEK